MIAALIMALMPALCLAQQALPYEAGLSTFYTSLTGPVPFIISLVGIVACGAMLVFGGEISGFLRTMVFLVLVISVIVQATSIVKIFGGHWQGETPGGGTTSLFVPTSDNGTA